jgi:hypothetical protein
MAEFNFLSTAGLISLPEYTKTKEEWLEKRKGRVSATKVYYLLGYGGFVRWREVLSEVGEAHTVRLLKEAKLYKTGKPPPTDCLPLVWGNAMEPEAKKAWFRLVNPLYPDIRVADGGHHVYPNGTDVYTATPDAYAVDNNQVVLLEFKCCYTKPAPLFAGDIPLQYLFQIQHQLLVTGASKALLVYYQTLWHSPLASLDQPCGRPVRLSQWLVRAWAPEQQRQYLAWLDRIRGGDPPRSKKEWEKALRPNQQRLREWALRAVEGFDPDVAVALDGRIRTPASVFPAWLTLCQWWPQPPPAIAASIQRQRLEEIVHAQPALLPTPCTDELEPLSLDRTC